MTSRKMPAAIPKIFCYPNNDNFCLDEALYCIGAYGMGCGTAGYQYIPGYVNMFGGAWPPSATGPDVTYLVNFFRGTPTSHSCLLDGFWASADANGDCNIIGSDVTKLVNVFRGNDSVGFCVDYPPAWPPIPEEAPLDWPGCE